MPSMFDWIFFAIVILPVVWLVYDWRRDPMGSGNKQSSLGKPANNA